LKTYTIVLPSGDQIVLDSQDLEHLIYEGTITVNIYEYDEKDRKRLAWEQGHGKDHDKPYKFHPPSEGLAPKGLSALLSVFGRVARGEVGGEKDGGDE
jgi:hypothetical protein